MLIIFLMSVIEYRRRRRRKVNNYNYIYYKGPGLYAKKRKNQWNMQVYTIVNTRNILQKKKNSFNTSVYDL